MARGGYRAGSGRKSDAEYAAIRAIMDRFVKRADWGAMCKAMVVAAKGGNVRAFVALRDTRYGQPPLAIGGSTDLPPLRISAVVAVAPKRRDVKRSASA